MDQVRAFLSVVWKQRFWVLSVLCLIVGVLCWNMAASDLQTQFTKRQGEIKSAHDNVQTIKPRPVPPQ